MMSEETVPCVWCKTPTPMLGTKKCDRCWELSGRIERDIELSIKMVAHYKEAI